MNKWKSAYLCTPLHLVVLVPPCQQTYCSSIPSPRVRAGGAGAERKSTEVRATGVAGRREAAERRLPQVLCGDQGAQSAAAATGNTHGVVSLFETPAHGS